MLDRKTIKKDVKGILGGESRGPVFLATLIAFILVLVYFGAVWGIAQFYPTTIDEIKAFGDWANVQQAQGADSTQLTFNLSMSISDEGLSLHSNLINNVTKINLWAWLLELIIMLPLTIGIQKFMLRVIRLKNPSASTVLKGYTGPYFFRSILLPFWEAICLLGWRIVLEVLLLGMLAGTALATGLRAQDFAMFAGATSEEVVNNLLASQYIAQYGWIYAAVMCVWMVISAWLMVFKRISYSLSGMALAERPQIGVRKAVRASRRIARRNHFALFKVSLSFIGWYLLACVAMILVLAVGVGLNMLNLGQLGLIITLALILIAVLMIMYLIMPYRVGVHAQCYVRLKRAALEDGVVTREDFRSKRELREMEAEQAQ